MRWQSEAPYDDDYSVRSLQAAAALVSMCWLTPPAKLVKSIDHYLIMAGVSFSDPVRGYIREIINTSRMKSLEEHALAEKLMAGRAAASELSALGIDLNDPAAHILTDDWVRHLISLYTEGKRAEDHLYQANLRLVVFIAAPYARPGISLIDLMQEGQKALMGATETFDLSRGVEFSVYAGWHIRRAILMAVWEEAAAHPLAQTQEPRPGELGMGAFLEATDPPPERKMKLWYDRNYGGRAARRITLTDEEQQQIMLGIYAKLTEREQQVLWWYYLHQPPRSAQRRGLLGSPRRFAGRPRRGGGG